jgi:hypothetical protein
MAATHEQQIDTGQRSCHLTPRSFSLTFTLSALPREAASQSAAGTRLESAPLRPAMMEPMPGKKMLMMSISRPQLLVSIPGTSCPLRIRVRQSAAPSPSKRRAEHGKDATWASGTRDEARGAGHPLHLPPTHVMSLMTSLHGFDMAQLLLFRVRAHGVWSSSRNGRHAARDHNPGAPRRLLRADAIGTRERLRAAS